ncbi:biosynthetic arginine decarboxylase [Desulforhopalus singaporensis]|uniref:Arginine decarboxylase n=1 Tax=Desulforhopalus singaporensis TaxID=91360 RepID=A0A1H0QV54_9BACT|nr:biosynthetic arginine decarboxylase [Desulforhopalus singaporensis]SDP21080.1 arginine decarboxylase [Desulforhopalus singaporensis]
MNWTLEKAADLYNIDKWGAEYFSIDAKGDVVVSPKGSEAGPSISLLEVIKEVEARGHSMPVLLRIENILGSQIRLLNETFRSVITQYDYKGEYKGVFPVKVNQQEHVVEAVAEFGAEFNHGLEAGSKSELIAAISMLGNRDAFIICNGYKDEEFIDLGLYAVRMGYQIFFVVEVPGEIDLLIERAKYHDVMPSIGLRIKLATQAEGKWSESGGESSVFGLTMSHVVEVIDRLLEEEMLDSLKLLHYHIGSQIPDISDIRAGAMEACRLYEELVKEGAPMGYLDLGGGLAVDYDGSNTNSQSSRNYTMVEYCSDIVESISTVLDKHDIPHPTIITESGRAIVAYSSVLLFNILDVSAFEPSELPKRIPETQNDLLENLMLTYTMVSEKNIQETCNDTLFYRTQARQLFKHGQISIRQRAIAESLVQHIFIKIREISKTMPHIPRDAQEIIKLVYDIYYGNFSLFQSLPDVWAIDQLMPTMPIHRLGEEPTRPAIISDITCDCDGKIDKFPDIAQPKKSILLHPLKEDEEYYLGVFLVGAYQETLGDLHNLFGDTNVVSIHVNDDGSYNFSKEIEGDSVEDVLSYVEYDLKAVRSRLKALAEDSIKKGYIKPRERKTILRAFEEGLRGYTYFEKE